MMRIDLICVGRLKERYFHAACAEYAKRLSRDCRLEVAQIDEKRLPASPTEGVIAAALEKEAGQIRAKIRRGSVVIAMCVEGDRLGSEAFAKMISDCAKGGDSSMTFVIGGSHGLSEALKREADVRLSMSDMTFAHHLARVMLLEQIYRAFRILAGSGYHK